MPRLRFLPDPSRQDESFVADFLRRETVGGTIALVAAVVAVLWANSPFGEGYRDLRHVTIGPLDLEHWAADGALAVLAVVGSALPPQVRAFLLTLAVVDDLIVIAIIAFFFTDQVHLGSLGVAATALTAYAVAQRLRVTTPLIHFPLAVVAWWFTHESGIHATIAGVLLGLLTRVRPDADEEHSPAERLEHRLAPLSSGVAVPFFALMSDGVEIGGGSGLVRDPVVLGVVAGLVIGKPLGVYGGAGCSST